MSEIAHKLAELEYSPFQKDAFSRDEQLSSELKRLGVELPDDYAAFLTEFPEPGMFNREAGFRMQQPRAFTGPEGVETVEALFGRCPGNASVDIFSRREFYLEELGPSYLVIGEVTGNDKICMCCAGQHKGRILIWDHERFADDSDAFYTAFDSFSAFIDALFEYEWPEEPVIPDERVHWGISLRLLLRDMFKKSKR